jgi:hypothetical protein
MPLTRLHKSHLWEEYAPCMMLKLTLMLTLRQAADI